MVYNILKLHPGITLLIGVVVFVVLYLLQSTTMGFWLVGGLYSVIWGFIVRLVVYTVIDSNILRMYIS